MQVIKKFTSIDEVNNLTNNDVFKPSVALIGIGGAGTNAVNNMIQMELSGVKFVVINTDAQSLEKSISPYKIQIGPPVTKGLGAGSKPEIGIQAAEESIEDIKNVLKGINLLFITCGMGGGTGTGASQVVAKVAKDMGILTMAFVTQPFNFEGSQRLDIAALGISQLEQCVDSLVLISNQNLFSVVNDKTSILEAFRVTDKVLYSGIKAITDLIVSNGLVNLDFNDIKTVIECMGRTMVGYAEASGQDRAEKVAFECLHNSLLEDSNLNGAKKLLINITGGEDMTLHEVDFIINMVKTELTEDAFINFGTVTDPSLEDRIKVSVVATGLDTDYSKKYKKEVLPTQRKPINKPSNEPSKQVYSKGLNKEAHSSSSYSRVKPNEERILPQRRNHEDDHYENLKDDASSLKYEDYLEKEEDGFSKETVDKIYQSIIENKHKTEVEVADTQYNAQPTERVSSMQNLVKNKVRIEKERVLEKEEDQEENDEDITSSANLFDIIAKNKIESKNLKESQNNIIQEEDFISIKNRNKVAKPAEKKSATEDSFFDLPSFLKKK